MQQVLLQVQSHLEQRGLLLQDACHIVDNLLQQLRGNATCPASTPAQEAECRAFQGRGKTALWVGQQQEVAQPQLPPSQVRN